MMLITYESKVSRMTLFDSNLQSELMIKSVQRVLDQLPANVHLSSKGRDSMYERSLHPLFFDLDQIEFAKHQIQKIWRKTHKINYSKTSYALNADLEQYCKMSNKDVCQLSNGSFIIAMLLCNFKPEFHECFAYFDFEWI